MSWLNVATVGVGIFNAVTQGNAAEDASAVQAEAAESGIAEQRRQFDALQELLAPYVQAGEEGLAGQMSLAGLSGRRAQRRAISAIESGPQYETLVQQGEEAILQNASATGGLRGGNTQGALAQFRPQILSQLIDQQYGRLGGLTGIGQASAAGVGASGLQTGANIAGLYGDIGAAQAGGILGVGQANANLFGTIGGAVGNYLGQQEPTGGGTF